MISISMLFFWAIAHWILMIIIFLWSHTNRALDMIRAPGMIRRSTRSGRSTWSRRLTWYGRSTRTSRQRLTSFKSTLISWLIEGQAIICGKSWLPVFSIGKQYDEHVLCLRLQLPEIVCNQISLTLKKESENGSIIKTILTDLIHNFFPR